MKLLRDHAMSPERRYWHTRVGYNDRMTNLQAALGFALERIDNFLSKRREVMAWYRAGLGGLPGVRLNPHPRGEAKGVYWMVCIEVKAITESLRGELMQKLKEAGVDSRPYFYPVSDMPMYERAATPVTPDVSVRGINLPSYFDLQEDDVAYICDAVKRVLAELRLL